jgi:hypothetical protein
MRRGLVVTVACVIALAATSLVQAKPIPTTPSITGAVYTTVNLYDPNYANECHNGNPAVNCNQYGAKEYVFLNGGPAKNHLSPDGVYFYAVLAPGGQADPSDGTAENLSDDYDCYLNRRIQLTGGEVTSTLQAPVGSPCGAFTSAHFSQTGPSGMFVQLAPYANTPNPGGVYIMAVCYIGPTADSRLTNGRVSPSQCKYDAFKVRIDDTKPPICTLVSRSGPSITVAIQDGGSGLKSIDAVATNATIAPDPVPVEVGSTDPFSLTATKINTSSGARLVLTVVDVAGNQIVCDPVYGARRHAHSAVAHAGVPVVLRGVRSDQGRLWLRTSSSKLRHATVTVNGHRFATLSLQPGKPMRLDIGSVVGRHARNTIRISATGVSGTLLVRVSNHK